MMGDIMTDAAYNQAYDTDSQRRINRKWPAPKIVEPNTSAVFTLKIGKDGKQFDWHLQKSSGIPEYDSSAEIALKRPQFRKPPAEICYQVTFEGKQVKLSRQ